MEIFIPIPLINFQNQVNSLMDNPTQYPVWINIIWIIIGFRLNSLNVCSSRAWIMQKTQFKKKYIWILIWQMIQFQKKKSHMLISKTHIEIITFGLHFPRIKCFLITYWIFFVFRYPILTGYPYKSFPYLSQTHI